MCVYPSILINEWGKLIEEDIYLRPIRKMHVLTFEGCGHVEKKICLFPKKCFNIFGNTFKTY